MSDNHSTPRSSRSGQLVKWGSALLGVAVIGIAAAQYFHEPPASSDKESIVAGHADHGLERTTDASGKVVWTCSMHPQIQLPAPGKCPICFMDLIRLEIEANKAAAQSLRQVEMNVDSRKLAEIEVTPVRRQSVAMDIRMVGKVEYDETRVGSITAWTGGRIDKLYVDSTGSVVQRGQAMALIYSPELRTAQAELIQASKALNDAKASSLDLVRRTASRTVDAAREKLRLLGLSKGQIEAVLQRGTPTDHITLNAPQGGIVIKKDVVEGMYVQTGMPIYTIADLTHLWVVLEAYESDLTWITMGSQVQFTAEAYPGKEFSGRIVYIDPVVNPKTRTVGVRLEVANTDGSLKPGMFVQAVQRTPKDNAQPAAQKGTDDPLVIPASAPLITGKRAVVYVQPKDKPGTFIGREIVLGPRAGDTYIVRSGLSEGELVVSKGSFKIDSALQIQARPSMMNPGASEAPVAKPAAAHEHADMIPAPQPEPDFQIPEVLLSKLHFVGQRITAIDDALRIPDLDSARSQYAQLRQSIRDIDASMLEGEAKLTWREYAMLLTNDAVLGSEAKDFKRLHEVHALTHTHYSNLSTSFGVGRYGRSLMNTAPAAPAAFQQQLGAVYAAYAPLADALGKDDADAARSAATVIKETLANVDMTLLDHAAHTQWMQALTDMQKGLAAIRTAEGLEGMRAGFEPLTTGLTDAITGLGIRLNGPLYELKCPMAFDGKGATWLQQDEGIRNPYFGAAMYQCGEVTRQLTAE